MNDNYGTLIEDPDVGLSYVTDYATKKKLYKLPECDICGMVPWSFTGTKDGWDCCKQHASERRERNDND